LLLELGTSRFLERSTMQFAGGPLETLIASLTRRACSRGGNVTIRAFAPLCAPMCRRPSRRFRQSSWAGSCRWSSRPTGLWPPHN